MTAPELTAIADQKEQNLIGILARQSELYIKPSQDFNRGYNIYLAVARDFIAKGLLDQAERILNSLP